MKAERRNSKAYLAAAKELYDRVDNEAVHS